MGRTGVAARTGSEADGMAGYAIIWLFVVVIGLLFLLTAIGYYAARLAFFLRRYWSGK